LSGESAGCWTDEKGSGAGGAVTVFILIPRTLTMKRPPAVPCRGTERLLDHDTSLPTDSDDGQCLCEQRQHTPVTSGDTTLSECRSLASLPKRCCRPSPSLPHNQSIPSPLHNRHCAISGNVTGLVLVGCLLRLRRSVVFEHRRSRLELRLWSHLAPEH
jgi:hypothetical protein